MKGIISKIEYLSEKYPEQISLYTPVSKKDLLMIERILNIQLDQQLKELYLFSNGMSFVDYCVSGINNKKILNLSDINSHVTPYRGETFSHDGFPLINFFGTSGGESYFYIHDEKDVNHKVMKQYSMLGDKILIANSIEDFFEQFLDKMEILLKHIKKEDIIMYFDDDILPGNLSEWSPK